MVEPDSASNAGRIEISYIFHHSGCHATTKTSGNVKEIQSDLATLHLQMKQTDWWLALHKELSENLDWSNEIWNIQEKKLQTWSIEAGLIASRFLAFLAKKREKAGRSSLKSCLMN